MKKYVLTITDERNNIVDVVEGVTNIITELENVVEDLNGNDTYEDYENERLGFAFQDDDDEGYEY
jgi:hypothetical protein